MKRYYAHFTILYPNIYLKNIVVELDCENRISSLIPYCKEIEKTEFHSGYIYLIPSHISLDKLVLDNLKNELQESQINDVCNKIDMTISYQIYDDSCNKI